MIKFIKNIYFELMHSQYVKNLFVLIGGVGFSQLIPLLLLPILTRFFSPVDFGVFALFMAIIQLLAIAMTFRLEMAVVLPQKDSDAALLCFMSFWFLLLFSLIIFFLFLLLYYSEHIFDFRDTIGVVPDSIFFLVLCLIPLGSFFLGCYNILYSWNNRLELYKKMSYSHVIHSFFSTPGSILIYFSPLKSVGLIIGQILGRVIACTFLLSNLTTHISLIPKDTIWVRCKFLFKEYKKFVVFETPHSILNFISQKIIIAFFSVFFGFFTVGIFELA